MRISMKNIAVLGSTGSIGTQTLEIVRANDDLNVVSLAAGSNIEMLEKQIREFKPQVVCVYNEKKAEELKTKVSDTDVKIVTGMDGLIETAVIKTADIVLTAVVGMIGIRPTIAAIKAGKDIVPQASEASDVCGSAGRQERRDAWLWLPDTD